MRRAVQIMLVFSALLLTFAVYAPGLHGAFLFDDNINILSNEALRLHTFSLDKLKGAIMSGSAGIFGRPVSMASFALDHLYSGMSAHAFKLTNLIIHLATGVAVLAFTRLVLQASQLHAPNQQRNVTAFWISWAVAAAWLLHPLNLTSVLYIVQRMTSLAALFSLLGLSSYIWGRLRVVDGPDLRGWIAIGAALVVFTPLAALSKESGALLPLFLLLTEIAFFRFCTYSPKASVALKCAFTLTVALPALAVLVYTLVRPEWITASYNMRHFTMAERLMTETRVLWLYIRLAIAPDLSILGLYHDDLTISTSLLTPITTLTSSLGLAALLGLVLVTWRRQRLLAYGIAFFLLGHCMESSFLALELMHEHRNYLPLVGLLVPFFHCIITSTRFFDHKATPACVVAVLLTMFAVTTYMRANQWGDAVEMLVKEVEHHPDSTRANLSLANFYNATPAKTVADADMLYENAFKHYVQASDASPHDPIGLFGLIGLNLRANLEPDPSWQVALEGRIRNFPMAASTVVAIMRLEECFANQTCPIKAASIEGMIKAALANRTMQDFQRTQLLFTWSSFLEKEKHDIPGAANVAYQATALSPNDLSTREALVTTLVNLRYDTQAREQLAALKRMDKLQLSKNRTDELSAILDQRQRSAPSTP